MKANKVTVAIKIEALDIAVTQGLVSQAVCQIEAGYEEGKLMADDGDTVEWKTSREPVSF